MPGLPWARLDANIGGNDKIAALLADPSPHRWRALASYMVAIAWSVGQGTDGDVRRSSLSNVHGIPATARLLVQYELWEPADDGWHIHNFELRQQSTATTESVHSAKRRASIKGNCIRHHGPDCGCWKDEV